MHDAWLLLAALFANVAGLAWLAFAMDVHWRQVHASRPLTARTVSVLRILGVLALALSLFLCLSVDHVSMASLVWVMSLAAAALAVAFMLTWKPRWLAILIVAAATPAARRR